MRTSLESTGRFASAFCGCVALVLTCAVSHAQERIDIESFEPAPVQEGSILSVYGARTLARGAYSFTLMGSYARQPLSLESGATGSGLGDLVGSIGTLTLMGGYGLWNRFDVGLAIPVHRVAAGSTFAQAPPSAVRAALVDETQIALGDIRVVPRFSVLERREHSGWGLAALLPFTLPTGDNDVYAGESFRIEPRLAADFALGRALLAANLGYLVRDQVALLGSQIGNLLRWGAGADVQVIQSVSLLAEISGAFNLGSNDFTTSDAPMEALLGLRYRRAGWSAELGAGPGLVRGVTAPAYRALAAISYAATPERDPDHDDIYDDADRCPAEPEDRDVFQDADGCPDPDNDDDGVPDASDRCPNEAEDREGFEDTDGCPEVDHDGDTVLDANDRCPNEPEDRDGFEDADGCPDLDNDRDGVLDSEDRCPNEAGAVEQQGCVPVAPPPEEPASRVELMQEQIELKEVINFSNESAEIQPQSQPLLDDLAKLIQQHTELTSILIEGHTDARGGRDYNMTLSSRRAEAVMRALVERGVDARRVRAVGMGPDRPLVSNDTVENRDKNRRVELHVERRGP